MNLARVVLASILLGLVGPAVPAQDKIEDPLFLTWSKHKKGTSVTKKTTVSAGGKTNTFFSKETLIELGEERVVVETTRVNEKGEADDSKPSRKTLERWTKAIKGFNDDPTGPGIPGAEADGVETLKIDGIEFKCKRFKLPSNGPDAKVVISDQMPGRVVKLDTRTIKWEVVGFSKP